MTPHPAPPPPLTPPAPKKKVALVPRDYWPYDNNFNNSPREIVNDDREIIEKIKKSRYSILSVNIRSLNKNIDHMRKIVNELKPDLVSMCETFNPHPGFVGINDYHKIILKKELEKLVED